MTEAIKKEFQKMDKAENAFFPKQLIELYEFKPHQDVVLGLLSGEKKYTKTQVRNTIKDFLKKEVR